MTVWLFLPCLRSTNYPVNPLSFFTLLLRHPYERQRYFRLVACYARRMLKMFYTKRKYKDRIEHLDKA